MTTSRQQVYSHSVSVDWSRGEEKQHHHLHQDQMDLHNHSVQFYKNEEFLLNSLSRFINSGLAANETCIVVATEAHLKGLEQRLLADGLDLTLAQQHDQYITRDAATTLSTFMVDGMPEPQRFTRTIGGLIERASRSGRRVRIFGEMVALLWAEGNQVAAIRLEELWNKLYNNPHPFSLLCAYAIPDFAGENYEQQFAQICQQHSLVIPDESYTGLASSDARLRLVSALQQKANSLEAEIAERKIAEDRLRASENRYRRLFEASTDGILIVDPQTQRITDANPSVENLLGYTHRQLLDQDLWQIGLFQDQEAMLAALRDLREKRFVHYEMLPLRTKNGQQRYVEFVSNRFQANGHEVIQCNMRDVTARKLLEERKDTFISMASHELKTPVTSLKGFTQILKRRLKHFNDPQTQLFLERMDAQLKKLTNLIGDLLDLSRLQTGSLAMRKTLIDLDELVRETAENVQAASTTHRILIQGETHAQVYGDQDRLGQVLINLLTNAIKYSAHADTVIVHLKRECEQVEVAVEDFGIGIAPEYHAHIFERFYRVPDSQEATYPGLGIGLYITRTLVEQHGGRLWLESQKGVGSTFHFTLPLPKQDASPSLQSEESR